MVVIILTTVFVAGLVYKRYTKRRAQKRAIKLAALNRAIRNPVDATDETLRDEVIIIERESTPPPYSMPTPHPDEPSEDPPHFTVPGLGYSGTYARDKPPPYSTTVLQIQNP